MGQITPIQVGATDAEQGRHVFQLAAGFSHRSPLELGEDQILDRDHIDRDGVKQHRNQPGELCLAEGPRLPAKEIDLPPRIHIDDVELAPVLQGFEGGCLVHVMLAGWQRANQSNELIRRGINDQIDVLGGPRNAMIGARKRSGQHRRDSCLIQRRQHAPEDSLGGQRSAGGGRCGAKAFWIRVRASRRADQLGCNERNRLNASSRAASLMAQPSPSRSSPDMRRSAAAWTAWAIGLVSVTPG